MDWNAVRAQFPGLDDRTFLDAACVSLTPASAEDAVARFAKELTRPSHRNASEHHLWMDGTREEATGHVAALLGVERRNVALVESTTHGLNIAAQSIPWREGDEVVMCNLEFLQVAIPFVQLAKTHGVRPVFLEHEAGVVPASAYAAAINERTKAVVLSSVQWCNGYRVDLEAVAEACRARGVWLIVDAVQQAGALPLPTDGVDFLLAGGHKWLNAPMGTGFACAVRPGARRAAAGKLGLPEPDDARRRLGQLLHDPHHHAGPRLRLHRLRQALRDRRHRQLPRRGVPLGVAAGHERGGGRAVGGAHLVSWASGCRRGCAPWTCGWRRPSSGRTGRASSPSTRALGSGTRRAWSGCSRRGSACRSGTRRASAACG